MKTSLSWLKEFVPIRSKPEELAHQLTMAGIEVEAIEGSGDETILTLGITPNRSDCLSIVGIAREVSAIQKKVFKPKIFQAPKGKESIKNFLKVSVEDSKACPRYMARMIHGVKIGPSPSWLTNRLEQVGLRPINNVVDCTNYVLWELGHPLHAFDYKTLNGGEIVVKKQKGETHFTTLDGETRACDPTDLFIGDLEGPVALAGIMGGQNSEVQNATQDIVLEAACFEPKGIHRTSKRLKLISESSYRFERGVDPNGVPNALHRLTELIVKTAGGRPTQDWIDIYSKKIKSLSLELPLSEVRRILGVEISAHEAKTLLSALGLQVQMAAKVLKVIVPTYRPDLTRTIDLIEEIVRLKGYDKIQATLPTIKMNLPQQPAHRCAEAITIDCLTGLQYSEVCPLSFTSFKKAKVFDSAEGLVEISNPLSEDHACLRPSLMPGLLDAVAFNTHRQRKDIKLFELKKVFHLESGNVVETKHLGLIATGTQWPKQWQCKEKNVDFYSLKGLLQQLLTDLHLPDLHYETTDLPNFLVPTAATTIHSQGGAIGWIGLLNPEIFKLWDLDLPLYALEVDWDQLAGLSRKVTIHFKPLSKYPYIERDLALVVADNLSASKIEGAIKDFQNPWIEKIQFFDLFKGGNLPPDHKSVALNIHYASRTKTLTNEEVNRVHSELIQRLEAALPAQLRK